MATKFIDFIQQQDAVAFKESFETAVSEKVFAVLEAKKQEIAQSFFTEKKHVCPECGKAKCMCESESSERMGDPLAHSELAHHVANASATAAAAEHHKINFHAHIGKHTEAMAHGDHHAAHHHMEKAKMHAKAHHELTGHPIHEEMENHLGIVGHHGGGFTGMGTPKAGKKVWHWPAPAKHVGDTYSKEHPAPGDSKGMQIHSKMNPHHDDHGKHHGVEGVGSKEHLHHKALEEMGSGHHAVEKHHLKSKEVVKTMFPNTFKDTTADTIKRHRDVAKHHQDRTVSGWSPSPSQGERMHYITGRKTEMPASYIVHKEEHEKKHGKLHHKMTKKMMKLAHKHSKKHHEEEE